MKPTSPPSSGSSSDQSTRDCPQWAGTSECSRTFRLGGARYGTKLNKYCCKSCTAKGAEIVELKKEDQLEMFVIKRDEPQIEPIMDSWTETNVVSSLSIVDQISVIKAYSKFKFLQKIKWQPPNIAFIGSSVVYKWV